MPCCTIVNSGTPAGVRQDGGRILSPGMYELQAYGLMRFARSRSTANLRCSNRVTIDDPVPGPCRDDGPGGSISIVHTMILAVAFRTAFVKLCIL